MMIESGDILENKFIPDCIPCNNSSLQQFHFAVKRHVKQYFFHFGLADTGHDLKINNTINILEMLVQLYVIQEYQQETDC